MKNKIFRWKRINISTGYKPTMWYSDIYCRVMNKVAMKYWFCQCKYSPPYGLVISADCDRHG